MLEAHGCKGSWLTVGDLCAPTPALQATIFAKYAEQVAQVERELR